MRIEQVLRSGLFAIVVTILAGSPAMAQAEDGGPTEEGIEVHGEWIIEVYDGAQLVERREFANALTPTGATRISRILASLESAGEWWVGVRVGICEYFEVQHYGSCYEGLDWSADDVNVPDSGDNAGKLVITKSLVPVAGETGAFDLEGVATALGFCDNTTDPGSCTTGTNTRLTEKTLATPITVEPGQTVNITVIISFTG